MQFRALEINSAKLWQSVELAVNFEYSLKKNSSPFKGRLARKNRMNSQRFVRKTVGTTCWEAIYCLPLYRALLLFKSEFLRFSKVSTNKEPLWPQKAVWNDHLLFPG